MSRPKFMSPDRGKEIAGTEVLVMRDDVEFLPLAHPIAEFVGLVDEAGRPVGLA